MDSYKAVDNTIEDQNHRQIAVVVPVSCSKKTARIIAAYAAQMLNVEARNKARKETKNG